MKNRKTALLGVVFAAALMAMTACGQKNTDRQDIEGLQTMRTLGRNMAFLIKSIRLGREAYGLPEQENPVFTNFVR